MLRETQLLRGPLLSLFLLLLDGLLWLDLINEVGNTRIGEQLAEGLNPVDQVVKCVVEV